MEIKMFSSAKEPISMKRQITVQGKKCLTENQHKYIKNSTLKENSLIKKWAKICKITLPNRIYKEKIAN